MINNYEKHNLKKSVLGASIIMLSITGIFSYFIQSVKANELSKIEHVKTEYFNTYISQVDDSSSSLSDVNFVKLSDVKDVNFVIDYKIKIEDDSPTPDLNAISADDAAKEGVKDLKRIFGIETKDKIINLYYTPIGETNVRADWSGNIEVGDTVYYFSVDAISGKISTTCRDIKLNKTVNLGFDSKLMQDFSEYEALTREVVNNYKILPYEIASVNYMSQGYVNDNPDIQIQAADIKGNKAQLSFSRYDKKLLQVCYDNWVKEAELLEQSFLTIK